MDRLLLKFGVLAPVIYFATVVVVGAMNPGFNHMTQYVSELGAEGAKRPELFAYGIIAAGACGVLAGLGVLLGLIRRTRNVLLAILAGGCLVAWGASLVIGGLYPMPDPRHNAWSMGLAIQAAPLLFFLAIVPRPDMSGLKSFLVLTFLASGALLAIMMGVGGLVHKSDVGLWQRAYAVASIPWIALACLGLDQSIGRMKKKKV